MPLEILLAHESMLWTNTGLKKPDELAKKDLILGADRSGNICWREIIQVSKYQACGSCIHIISNITEVNAPANMVMCIQSFSRRTSKIEEITRKDKLRIISNPAYIWEKWTATKENEILTAQAFILGVAYRRVVLSEEKVVIKVPTEKVESLVDLLKKEFKLENLWKIGINIEKGPILGNRNPPWSWLVLESEQISNLIKSIHQKNSAPLFIRSNLKLYQTYIYGLTQVLGGKNEYGIVNFETFPWEIDARKLIYNLFFLFSIECNTKAVPSYSPEKIQIRVKESELKKVFDKPNFGLRGKKSVSNVRWIKKYPSSIYHIETEGSDWSPIVDLAYIL